MHVSMLKENTLNTCCDVLLHKCRHFVVSFESYISVWLQKFYTSPDFVSFNCLLLNDFDIFIEFDTVKNPEN